MDYKKANLATYEACAEKYMELTEDYWERHPKERQKLLEPFLASMAPGGLILDLGSCGGRDSAIFSSFGFRPICADFSERMIRIARARGLEGIVMDMERLGFRERSVNGVWAYASLVHLPRETCLRALREIFSLLKPGGIFALCVFEGEGNLIKQPSSRLDGAERYFSFWRAPILKRALREAGFKILLFRKSRPDLEKGYLSVLCEKPR